MSARRSLSTPYPNLPYSQEELQAVMRVHYDRIIDFITSEPFRALVEEISALPSHARPKFVHDVLLNDEELAARGVLIPDGILIQRSAFGDRRPTLFVVKHFLPEAFNNVWENVNITFDNEYLDSEVSRDRAICWRAPLPAGAQAQAMTDAEKLENLR